ncbi:MAG: LITAF-like zinc ribbon domain-containing protein [Bacteroidota bacterium]
MFVLILATGRTKLGKRFETSTGQTRFWRGSEKAREIPAAMSESAGSRTKSSLAVVLYEPGGPQERIELDELRLRRDPQLVECPHCGELVVTNVEFETSCCQYCCFVFLCCMWLFPCALIPCCVSDWSDVQHRCPHCGKCIRVARYSKTRRQKAPE